MKFDNKIFIANWKLNKTLTESKIFFSEILPYIKNGKVWIAPPVCNLYGLKLEFKNCMIGAQTVSSFESGAYTGEVSASMLKDINADFCIIGHSERRNIFFEDDFQISKKLNNLVKNNIYPILCVGETADERKKDLTFEKIENQILSAVDLVKNNLKSIAIAYEPIWAIGSSKPANPQEVNEVLAFIKKITVEILPMTDVKLIYGGSVTPDNISDFLNLSLLDGVLVGGASLDLTIFKSFIL